MSLQGIAVAQPPPDVAKAKLPSSATAGKTRCTEAGDGRTAVGLGMNFLPRCVQPCEGCFDP